MSNKIVPQIYRAIIDDVMANVAVDFEEYAMDEDLLAILQSKWEARLLETRVADFALAPGADDGNAAGSSSRPPASQASSNGAAAAAAASAPEAATGETAVKTEPEDVLRLRGGAGEEGAPRPQPNEAGLLPGDEVIDSDLDDSDDELRDDEDGIGEEGEIDIVFCVYDKVQRVKNKWKTVFKDGMIHINGRDYLFAKCQGEFEW